MSQIGLNCRYQCGLRFVLPLKGFHNVLVNGAGGNDNVKILINALGYKVLDPLLQISTDAAATDGEELFINTGNTSATGMVTSEGFVVLKGAVVNEKTSAKSLSAGMKKLRDRIFADGKVENMTTTEDILFSSSSAAAEFVLGYSASGPRTWKAKDGRTLKEIEDNATVD